MDNFEKIGYSILAAIALLFGVGMFMGMIVIWPVGLFALAIVIGIGALVIKVIKERLENKEDDYYSKNIKQ